MSFIIPTIIVKSWEIVHSLAENTEAAKDEIAAALRMLLADAIREFPGLIVRICQWQVVPNTSEINPVRDWKLLATFEVHKRGLG